MKRIRKALARRRARTLICCAALAVPAVLTACGAGPSSSSPDYQSAYSQQLAFSRCVRTHGVPDYPDPLSNGQEAPDAKHIAKGNPRFPAAQIACSHLLSNGGQPTQAQLEQQRTEFVNFARCMQTHGVPDFPEPITDSHGRPEFNLQAAGIDLSSPHIRAAALRCASLLHQPAGALTAS
jgi:hypothetical protein